MNNSKTTVGSIFTVIGLIPQAIQSLGLSEVPNALKVVGLVCAALSFIYVGYQAQDAK